MAINRQRILLAIDPGPVYSGWCVMNETTYQPIWFGKDVNEFLENHIWHDTWFDDEKYSPFFNIDEVAIEMVDSYGMPVGREVFQTCVQIGRFQGLCALRGLAPYSIYRSEEKLRICHSTKANDATIRQALVDRFAPNAPNHGKGTKQNPSLFYGFKKDVWQAFAVGVTFIDKRKEERGEN